MMEDAKKEDLYETASRHDGETVEAPEVLKRTLKSRHLQMIG
jgi:amino acid permease